MLPFVVWLVSAAYHDPVSSCTYSCILVPVKDFRGYIFIVLLHFGDHCKIHDRYEETKHNSK